MLNPSLRKYENKKGYFALNDKGVLSSWQYYTSGQLADADSLIKTNRERDCYNSIATFRTTHRSGDNIEVITEHYIDIDNHLSPFTKAQAVNFVEDVLKPTFDISLPEPSQIVFTGRGLQLHFFLKNADDIIKWQHTQNALLERVQAICYKSDALLEANGLEIDRACKDAARVLRTVGTRNSKSGTYAELIYSTRAAYTQDEIIGNYNLTWTTEKGRYKGKKHNLSDLKGLSKNQVLKASQKELKKFKPYSRLYSKETLNQERKSDLVRLITQRNIKGINEGYRNNLISIYVQLARETVNDAAALVDTVLELNNYFNSPLGENEIIAWCRSAFAKQLYFTNKYIIEKLGISIEEQEQLVTIISRPVKNARYYGKNREKVLSRANDRYRPTKTVNTMKRNTNKATARQLKEQGETVTAIAEKLNLSRKQVTRYLRGK